MKKVDEGLLEEAVMRRGQFKPLFSKQGLKNTNLKLKDYLSCCPVVGVK